MQRTFIVLLMLALSALACTYPGVIPSPTPKPTTVITPTTFTAESTPTLVPTQNIQATTAVPPTSARVVRVTPTRVSLSGNTGINVDSGNANNGGVSVANIPDLPSVASGVISAGFQVQAETVTGGTLLFPDPNSGVPLDYDSNGKGQRAVIDAEGRMLLNGAPYTGNGKHSKQRFVQARWSPDGRWLAYIVQMPDAEKGQLGSTATIDDGVWLLDTLNAGAEPIFLMRNQYDAPYDYPLRVAVNINWASDNDAMIISVRRPKGVSSILIGKGIRANDKANGLFSLLDYTGGTWQPDAQGYIGSTSPDSNDSVKVGIVGRDISKTQVIADGGGQKLWMQNPAQVPDGRYLFLAKPSDNGRFVGADGLALYAMWPNQQAQQVSQPLQGQVVSAIWSPGRTALLVVLNTSSGIQTKVINIDGSIVDYSEQGHGATSVHWGH